ncbi:Protein RALF-like [Actinidia chinensis var. chinensis]|uniref:Protein RALF-like n=1 Tax=Actinidia chinensis var. chinensis TaxID=1590841 RepID=A0A2R6QLG5_ACTCC|nr:Protein RALF-like [Actinidia chinensis var. chinensis]
MGFRVAFLILVVTLAVVAESSFNNGGFETVASFNMGSHRIATCNQQVGDCVEEEKEMMLGSEAARRVLAQQRYISYGALRANNVPCSRRGQSYYNCNQRGRANPYQRGCSYITHCARYTHR